jgi:hypothetical protein
MDPRTSVPWWQRLLFGFAATMFTLLLVVAFSVAQSLWREPGLHWFRWSDGGGIQIPVFVLYAGGLIALAVYLVVVLPLVLLWPVQSQLKHWYAFLCVAVLLPIAVFAQPWSHSWLLHDIRPLLLFPTFPVLCGGVFYLLLLRRQYARLNPPSTP